MRGFWYTYRGVAEICLGRLDAAIEEFKQALDAGNRTYLTYVFLAAAEAAKGNDAEAKLSVAEARRLNPQLTIKWFAEHTPVAQQPTIIVDSLRKAGLPEE